MYDLNPKSIILGTLYCNQACWITEMLLNILIGQSHDFSRAYSLFVARVASFAPEREAQGRKW